MPQPRSEHFIGIDVQVRRGCCYHVLDGDGRTVDSGWVDADDPMRAADQLAVVAWTCLGPPGGSATVGIDSPRMPLPEPRRCYWDRRRTAWRQRKPNEKGYGRHCEVAIKALGIANPQWTRPLVDSPAWMRLGYAIFEAMPPEAAVHEVFPSAAYSMLDDASGLSVSIDFAGFARGPKDMLDACLAAATVREFAMGRGFEVGGGDGLGSIVLPRPPLTTDRSAVLVWPGAVTETEEPASQRTVS